MNKAVRPLSAQEINELLPRRWRFLCFRSQYDIIGITWGVYRSGDRLAVDVSFSIGPKASVTLHMVRSAEGPE